MVPEVKTESMMMKDPEEVDKEEEAAEVVIDIDVVAQEEVPEMNKEEMMISTDKMLPRILNLKTLEEVLPKREMIEILEEENKEEEEMMITTEEDIEVTETIEEDVIIIKKIENSEVEIEDIEEETEEDTEEDTMIREEMIMKTEDSMIEKTKGSEAKIEAMVEDVMIMKTEDMMIEKTEVNKDLVEDSEEAEVASVAVLA